MFYIWFISLKNVSDWFDIVHMCDQAFSKQLPNRVWLFTKKRPLNQFSAVLANEYFTPINMYYFDKSYMVYKHDPITTREGFYMYPIFLKYGDGPLNASHASLAVCQKQPFLYTFCCCCRACVQCHCIFLWLER